MDKPELELEKRIKLRLIESCENLLVNIEVGDNYIYRRSWLRDTSELIDLLKKDISLRSALSGTKHRKEVLLREIQSVYNSELSVWNGSTRVQPLAFIIGETPEIGKSTILNELYNLFAKATYQEFSPGMVYTRQPDQSFWEGYNQFVHDIVRIPEVGAESAGHAKATISQAIKELTPLIDNSPYPLDMAFGEKGKAFMTSRMVVIDTNNMEMNFNIYFRNPAAYRRRFIYILIEVLLAY
jgi:hypothetical protein